MLLGGRTGDGGGVLGGRYDRIVAILVLIFGVVMFPLRFVLSHLYASTFPVVLVAAAVLYLLALRRDTLSYYPLPTLTAEGGLLLSTLSFLGMTAMVLVAVFAGERSLLFFGLAGLVGCSVLAQVVFVEEVELQPKLVLLQTVVLALLVRFAALYTSPGVIGVDPWSHVTFMENIVAAHSLSGMQTKYNAAPLYHLFATFLMVTADVSARNALYLTTGLTYPFLTLFVYFAARQLLPVRWSLLAVVLYAVSDHAIRWGITLIPTTMGLALYFAAFYFLVRVMTRETPTREVALLAFLIFGITLTHQVSSFVMLMTLVAVFITRFVVDVDALFPDSSGTDITGLLFFNGGLIILVWSITPYSSGTFTSVMANRLLSAVQGAGFGQNTTSAKNVASTAGGSGSSFMAQLVGYLDIAAFLMLLCLGVVGAIYVLRSRRASHTTLAFVVATGIMGFFALGLPLLGVSTFVPGRWYAFMYVLLAILSALGLGYLSYNLNPRGTLALVMILLVAFPTVSVLALSGTPDNPPIDSEQVRKSYTEPEIAAMHTIGATTNRNTPMPYTDDPYRGTFIRSGSTETAGKMVVPENAPVPHEMVVYREYQSEGAPLLFTANRSPLKEQIPREKVCPSSRNWVYSNQDVMVCTTPQ